MAKDLADALMAKDEYDPKPLYPDDQTADDQAFIKTLGSEDTTGDDITGGAQHYERAFKELQESGSRIRDLQTKREEQLAPIREEALEIAQTPNPQVPRMGQELQRQPPAPDRRQMMQEFKDNTNDIMVAFSALAMFGAMRNGPTAAASFLGGAFDGLAKGQAEQAALAYKQFQAESDRVVQTNKDIMGEYREILKSKQLDFDQKIEASKLVSSKWDDRIAAEQLQRKDFVTFEQLLAKREIANAQLEKAKMALEAMREKAAAQAQAQAQNNVLSIDEAKRRVERELSSGRSASIGLGLGQAGAANRKVLEQAYAEVAKERGMTQEQLGQRTRELTAENAGLRTTYQQEAKIGAAVNELKSFVPKAKEALAELPRGSVVRWNAVSEAYENERGDPRLAAASVWVQGVVNAYSIAAARGGVGAVDLRAKANGLLSTRQSPEAQVAALDAMQKEADIALKAPAQTRQQMIERPTAVGGGGAKQTPDDPLGILH